MVDFVRTGFEDFDEREASIREVKPLPLDPEILALLASQKAHALVVDRLVDVYRVFDRVRREKLKDKLEEVYDALKALGATIGISCFSLPHLSDC